MSRIRPTSGRPHTGAATVSSRAILAGVFAAAAVGNRRTKCEYVAQMMTDYPRRKYIGPERRGLSKDDVKNFYRCELCGGWVDRRDTVQVYDHIRPLPHLTEGREN